MVYLHDFTIMLQNFNKTRTLHIAFYVCPNTLIQRPSKMHWFKLVLSQRQSASGTLAGSLASPDPEHVDLVITFGIRFIRRTAERKMFCHPLSTSAKTIWNIPQQKEQVWTSIFHYRLQFCRVSTTVYNPWRRTSCQELLESPQPWTETILNCACLTRSHFHHARRNRRHRH